jgi:hypothetical protein
MAHIPYTAVMKNQGSDFVEIVKRVSKKSGDQTRPNER